MDEVGALPRRSSAADGATDFDRFAADERMRLVRLAWALSGDLGTAHDLTQEALLVVFERRATIGDHRSYARTVLVNRYRSQWRGRRREVLALRRLAGRPLAEVVLPEPSEDVWRAVQRLSRSQRVAVVLTVLEDAPIEDVAAGSDGQDQRVRHLR